MQNSTSEPSFEEMQRIDEKQKTDFLKYAKKCIEKVNKEGYIDCPACSGRGRTRLAFKTYVVHENNKLKTKSRAYYKKPCSVCDQSGILLPKEVREYLKKIDRWS